MRLASEGQRQYQRISHGEGTTPRGRPPNHEPRFIIPRFAINAPTNTLDPDSEGSQAARNATPNTAPADDEGAGADQGPQRAAHPALLPLIITSMMNPACQCQYQGQGMLRDLIVINAPCTGEDHVLQGGARLENQIDPHGVRLHPAQPAGM